MIQPATDNPWKSWKTPTDAISWAQGELPAHNPDWIQQQWESLKSDKNGKKAHLWVQFVLDIKVNEFADGANTPAVSSRTMPLLPCWLYRRKI